MDYYNNNDQYGNGHYGSNNRYSNDHYGNDHYGNDYYGNDQYNNNSYGSNDRYGNNNDLYSSNTNQPKTSSDFLLINKRDDANIHVEEDEERSMKPPRKHSRICFCCPCWLCLVITLSIIVIIGVLTYIFWPKIPDANINGIELANNEGRNSIRYQLPSGVDGRGGIELDLNVNINVQNDNFYDINVKDINTRIFIQTEDIPKTLIGEGNKEDIKFEKHSSTDFMLPLTVKYYMEGADPTLLYLLKTCSRHEPINIQYEVEIGLPFVGMFYKPKVHGVEAFTCPENGGIGDISSILMGDIYSSISDYLSGFIGGV